jgi:hypothetical protein
MPITTKGKFAMDRNLFDDQKMKDITQEAAEAVVADQQSFKEIAAKWAEGNHPDPNPEDEVDA